jgi:hypothetical protein
MCRFSFLLLALTAFGCSHILGQQPVTEGKLDAFMEIAVLKNLVPPLLPDSKVTPGKYFSNVTKDKICKPGYATSVRDVPYKDRIQAYLNYHMRPNTYYCTPDPCELDHLIPLELGGDNSLENLWPEPVNPHPNAMEKDALENELHKEVCNGKINLFDAQNCIATNWWECYQRIMPVASQN